MLSSMSVSNLTHSPRFQTVRLATGPTLRYADQGDVGGEPILFLHGWPDSWFSFSRVLPLLPRSHRLLLPDQRGFGASEKPDAGYGIPDLAADAVALLNAVSIDRATIVGHSLGSFVARCVALSWPERVARLVLIGSGVSAMNPVTREVQAAVRELADPVPVGFARDFQASTAHRPLPEWFFDGIVAESLKLPAHLWQALFDGMLAYEDEKALPRIAAPTLIIWGDRDALFPRADQDRLVSAIAGARLIAHTDTGHCPNWERPDKVAADLVAFVHETEPAVIRSGDR
jgi:pimeloyl-ACP methyl ester carboxylesterase